MAPFCDMMPNFKKIIKWHQEISQQLSQMSLRECWIKCLCTSKNTHNPHILQKLQVTLGISSLHGADTQLNHSECFSQGDEVLVWCWWSTLDGRKAEGTSKVSRLTSWYLNYNLHCFSEISVRFLFKDRSKLICTMEALTQAGSLLKLFSENMQSPTEEFTYCKHFRTTPSTHWPITHHVGSNCISWSPAIASSLITHAERGADWLVPSTACLGMVMQLNMSLLSVLFQ